MPPGWEAAARELAPLGLPAAGAFTAAGKRRLCEGKGGKIAKATARDMQTKKGQQQTTEAKRGGSGWRPRPPVESTSDSSGLDMESLVVLDRNRDSRKALMKQTALPSIIESGNVLLDALDRLTGAGAGAGAGAGGGR